MEIRSVSSEGSTKAERYETDQTNEELLLDLANELSEESTTFKPFRYPRGPWRPEVLEHTETAVVSGFELVVQRVKRNVN